MEIPGVAPDTFERKIGSRLSIWSGILYNIQKKSENSGKPFSLLWSFLLIQELGSKTSYL
jgi:hypothetical protein